MPASITAAKAVSHELIDLGVLPGASTPESVAFGINGRHEIVGWSTASNDIFHAVLWMYCPNYGLAEFALHDLTDLASLSGFGQALDINEAGLVVGRQVDSVFLPRPYLWDLTTLPSLATLELGTFATDPDAEGIAYGVNNSSPAVIVGNAQTDDNCFALGPQYRAFKYVEGESATSLTDLGADGSDTFSLATDVNSASTPSAAGFSANICQLALCNADYDAVAWDLGSSVTLSTLADGGASYGAWAFGINDSGQLVGMMREPNSTCLRHAAAWPSNTGTAVDLGSVGIETGDESVAYRLSNPGPSGELQVVGTNLSANRAWRWYRDGSGSWSSGDLNDTISPLCGWELLEALDVSDDGWIVGYGLFANQFRAFLLKPIECQGDLTRDCQVGGEDLGLLLAAYSCGSPCAACLADLNLDGVIDSADLGILLSNFEASCECFSCDSNFAERSSSAGDPYESALVSGLGALGFGSASAFTSWCGEVGQEQKHGALEWLWAYLVSQF